MSVYSVNDLPLAKGRISMAFTNDRSTYYTTGQFMKLTHVSKKHCAITMSTIS